MKLETSVVLGRLPLLVCVLLSANAGACAGDSIGSPDTVDARSNDTDVQEGPAGEGSSFDTLVVGDVSCYMALAYFPKKELNSILPHDLAIPDDATMRKFYPSTELKADDHPFLMSFCHGSNIRDVFTEKPVAEQEEIMFLFPVVYAHEDGTKYLCSYLPVLYLDSEEGVKAGRDFFGLRKEYHANLLYGNEGGLSKWWKLEGILEASFTIETDKEMAELPEFFARTLANPFLTISYPPESKTLFYQAKVRPDSVMEASPSFSWNYGGTAVKAFEDTRGIYSDYSFTMSHSMNAKQYFPIP